MRRVERRLADLEASAEVVKPKGRPILTEEDFIAAVKEAGENYESINFDDTPEPLLRRIRDLLMESLSKEAQNEGA